MTKNLIKDEDVKFPEPDIAFICKKKYIKIINVLSLIFHEISTFFETTENKLQCAKTFCMSDKLLLFCNDVMNANTR